jgi:D-alanine-D-alanine ligase
MERKIRVAVIFGGKSAEHEVSLMSAASVIQAIPKDKYEVLPVAISKTGRWILGESAKRLLETGSGEQSPDRLVVLPDAEHGLVEVNMTGQNRTNQVIDVVFPVLHGTFGEDGTIQGLLELADVPYVGGGVAASAAGMDKVLMKALFRQEDLPVVDWLWFLRSEWQNQREAILRQVEERFGFPCFVKPANLGSSVGVSKAHDAAELGQAMDLAARYDRKILVEAAVNNAREIECSVLGNDDPIASLPGEVVPSREFYDYEAKYIDDNSKLLIPADLDDATVAAIKDLAVRSFKAIDCAGMGRVDFLLSKDDGKIWVNEINTIPGFTRISMYPKLWEVSGIPYPELVDRLIQLAIERHEDKHKSETSYS